MNKQTRFDVAYMRMAMEWAQMSYAKRKKVGAFLVKDGQIISDGYNGTPHGYDNACEVEGQDVTRWEVLHAESNVLAKCMVSGDSTKGATMYVTMSPCRDCSKMIVQAKIARVVYLEEYRDTAGLDLMRKCGIIVEKIDMPNA